MLCDADVKPCLVYVQGESTVPPSACLLRVVGLGARVFVAAVVKQLARTPLLLLAAALPTRTHCFASERRRRRRERAESTGHCELESFRHRVVRRARPRSSLQLLLYTGLQHLIACPGRQTYEHLPPPPPPSHAALSHFVFLQLISHYTSPVPPTTPAPIHFPIPTRSLSIHPRLPVPDTPSCDSTTARLTTPTLPLQRITSISPVRPPPAVPTRRSTPLRLDTPSPYTSYQPSHLSNHPSNVSGSTTAIGHRETFLSYSNRQTKQHLCAH